MSEGRFVPNAEIAPLHSSTWSAIVSSVGGTFNPSALAVLKLLNWKVGWLFALERNMWLHVGTDRLDQPHTKGIHRRGHENQKDKWWAIDRCGEINNQFSSGNGMW